MVKKLSYFCQSSYVNKQNMCFWGKQNPHLVTEAPV